MKLKPIYLYLFLLFVALTTLIILSTNEKDQTLNPNIADSEMPNDDVHQNLGKPSNQPSGSNVSGAFMTKMKEVEESVAQNPSDTSKIKEYADLLTAAHNEDNALEYYNKILEIDKNRVDVISKIAIIKFNKNLLDEAKSYVVQIIAIQPENTQAIYNLGVIEARIGDIEAAKKQWKDLVTNHPNTKMSDMAKESLERLSSN